MTKLTLKRLVYGSKTFFEASEVVSLSSSTGPGRITVPAIEKKRFEAGELLAKAAASLHEAALTISQLELRVQLLEAMIRAPVPLPLPIATQTHTRPLISEIDAESRTHVSTAVAARWLNRKPQTLRKWACYEDGLLRPLRVNGRLAWSVADIRRVLESDS